MKFFKNKKLNYFILFTFIFLLVGCTSKIRENNPKSKSDYALGTIIDVKIYSDCDDKVFTEIFNRIKNIEKKMSINLNKSEVIDINNNSGSEFVSVSKDTFNVIKRSLYYSKLSQGKFDVTIGPFVKLWNIGTDKERIPSNEEIENKKSFINYKNILLDEKNNKVKLLKKDMIIDLGGIAKGYAADEVHKILKKNNIEQAVVNIGGNIFAMNSKANGEPWKIGIQNPLSKRGSSLGAVDVVNKSIVTSGIYERYFEKEGKRYHHILDTSTGYPVDNNLASVTIISDKSIDGDALSTATFSLGLEKGMNLVKKFKSVEAIFITKDSKIYVSPGLKDKLKITDPNFKLSN